MDANKRRILYFGAHQDETNSEAEIARALERLGHEVIRLNEKGVNQAALVSACAEHLPDVLLGAKFRLAGADGFDRQSAKKTVAAITECRPHIGAVIGWQFDALMPAFSAERWQWAETLAPAVDVFACTDGMAAGKLPNGYWLPQGSTDLADDDADWPDDLDGQILFVGTAYRERADLMHHLRAKFGSRFRHVPSWRDQEKEVRGRDLTALVRRYQVCICPHYPLWPGYWSNRLVTLARHGALMASPTIQGMADDGWIADTNYLALPATPPEMAAAIEQHLRREAGELRAIQRAGYEHARTLSYDQRCAELLARLDAVRSYH